MMADVSEETDEEIDDLMRIPQAALRAFRHAASLDEHNEPREDKVMTPVEDEEEEEKEERGYHGLGIIDRDAIIGREECGFDAALRAGLRPGDVLSHGAFAVVHSATVPVRVLADDGTESRAHEPAVIKLQLLHGQAEDGRLLPLGMPVGPRADVVSLSADEFEADVARAQLIGERGIGPRVFASGVCSRHANVFVLGRQLRDAAEVREVPLGYVVMAHAGMRLEEFLKEYVMTNRVSRKVLVDKIFALERHMRDTLNARHEDWCGPSTVEEYAQMRHGYAQLVRQGYAPDALFPGSVHHDVLRQPDLTPDRREQYLLEHAEEIAHDNSVLIYAKMDNIMVRVHPDNRDFDVLFIDTNLTSDRQPGRSFETLDRRSVDLCVRRLVRLLEQEAAAAP